MKRSSMPMLLLLVGAWGCTETPADSFVEAHKVKYPELHEILRERYGDDATMKVIHWTELDHPPVLASLKEAGFPEIEPIAEGQVLAVAYGKAGDHKTVGVYVSVEREGQVVEEWEFDTFERGSLGGLLAGTLIAYNVDRCESALREKGVDRPQLDRGDPDTFDGHYVTRFEEKGERGAWECRIDSDLTQDVEVQ